MAVKQGAEELERGEKGKKRRKKKRTEGEAIARGDQAIPACR